MSTKSDFKFLYGAIRNALVSKKILDFHYLAKTNNRQMFSAVNYAINEPTNKAALHERLWRYKVFRELVPKKRRY
ncbi:MAG TPA: hypothetical protein DEB62_14855 [Vibrio sp.]|nr:hypothetical protein [Vibrio sp.]